MPLGEGLAPCGACRLFGKSSLAAVGTRRAGSVAASSTPHPA